MRSLLVVFIATTLLFPVRSLAQGPAGPSGSIQSNQSSAFYGDANLTYDPTKGLMQTQYSAAKGPHVDVTHTGFSGGADKTGVTDATAAINAALAFATSVGYGGSFPPLYFPSGKYLISSASISIPSTVGIIADPNAFFSIASGQTATLHGMVFNSGTVAVPTVAQTQSGNEVGLTGVVATQRVYDVREYGALGVTGVDDRPAIQNAINACNSQSGPTGMGVVYFPAGTYNINSTMSYTPPGGTAQNVGLLYESCLWRGDAVHRTKLNFVYTTSIADAVVAVSGTDFAGNASSGGIVNMEFDANAVLSAPTTGSPVSGANRCVIFNAPVDQNFRFDNNDCASPLQYGLDLPAGWINAHFNALRFDGTGAYFLRLECASGDFLGSFDLSNFTFATSSGTSAMQPLGNIQFVIDSGCSNAGAVKFRNARIEWNNNGNGIAVGGALIDITGPTLTNKGGSISVDNIALQNQKFDPTSHQNYFVKFDQADGSNGSGFVFAIHDFYYSGLSGFKTGVGNWNGTTTVAWPGGTGTSIINAFYGATSMTNFRAATTMQGNSNTEIVASALGPADTSARFTQDASGDLAWGPGGAAATDTTLGRCSVAGLCVSGLKTGSAGTLYSVSRTLSTGSITPTAVPAQSCSSQTFPVATVLTSDLFGQVRLEPSADLGNITVQPLVTTAGTLTLKFCNPTASSVTPAAGNYEVNAFH
jgi:hypothetical protein